jgi:uncharacterized membrane protein
VPDMAIVSLVGKQLKNMIGISGKFFSVLGDNNINIEMISQGMYHNAAIDETVSNTSQVPARSTFLVSLRSVRQTALSMSFIRTFSLSWSRHAFALAESDTTSAIWTLWTDRNNTLTYLPLSALCNSLALSLC